MTITMKRTYKYLIWLVGNNENDYDLSKANEYGNIMCHSEIYKKIYNLK